MSIRMKVRPVVHDANDEDVLWRIAAELGFRKGCQAHSYRRFELRSIGYGFLRRYSDSLGGNEAKSPDDLLFAVYPRRVHCPHYIKPHGSVLVLVLWRSENLRDYVHSSRCSLDFLPIISSGHR